MPLHRLALLIGTVLIAAGLTVGGVTATGVPWGSVLIVALAASVGLQLWRRHR